MAPVVLLLLQNTVMGQIKKIVIVSWIMLRFDQEKMYENILHFLYLEFQYINWNGGGGGCVNY